MTQPILKVIQDYENDLSKLCNAITRGGSDTSLASSLLWYSTYLFQNTTKILDFERNKMQLSGFHLQYASLKKEFPPPFENLDVDDVFYRKRAMAKRKTGSLVTEAGVPLDPLSGEAKTTNEKRTLINDMSNTDLLKYIVMDVKRIFPHMQFYDDARSQGQSIIHKRNIIEMLYLFVKRHNIPYKQGLHEICGVVYYNLYRNSLSSSASSEVILTGDKRFISDLFQSDNAKPHAFFMANHLLLAGAEGENIFITRSVYSSFYLQDETLLSEIEKFTSAFEQLDYNLFYLINVKNKIDNRIWMIKWFRLLMIREFTHENGPEKGKDELWLVRLIWDKAVAYQGMMAPGKSDALAKCDFVELLPYIIMVLLIKFKIHLIVNYSSVTESQDDELLYSLLHFDKFYFAQTKLLSREKIGRDWNDIIQFAVKLYFHGLQNTTSANQWWRIGNEINAYFHSTSKTNGDDFVAKEYAFYQDLEDSDEANGQAKLKEQFYNKVKLEIKLKYRVLKSMN